ncbi:hypothetical protein [Terrabacter sp. C0L_2]|uniref:hypothetical protein n=1 Tax=Terrabacter sp. C0L_2 TaxID=3108389 RepID=UPI002ED4F032|nr:hypothetical protein U5C87_01320 [Terrabacter sp. C0L_2]
MGTTAGADDANGTREHLIVLPERDVAESLADDLEAEGLSDVRVVREALAGEDDSEAHEWAVYVRTPSDPAYAVRFEALAAAHDGWYDPDPHG